MPVKTLLKIFLQFILGVLVFITAQSANAQIAVLNSDLSSKLYNDMQLGSYSELWQEVVETLNHSNIKFNVINENTVVQSDMKGYEVIVLPLIIDLPQDVLDKIENYTRQGGKIIVIFPDFYQSYTIQKLSDILGIQVESPKRISYKSYVNWVEDFKPEGNYFPISTKIATIKLTPSAKSSAVWDQIEENAPAITISSTGSYIGWRWGNDGNLPFNISAFKATLEQLAPGVVKKELATMELKEFKSQLDEITKLQSYTSDLMDSIILKDSMSSLAEIQEHIYLSKVQQDLSKTYYETNDYEKAQDSLKKAKINAINAYAKAVPSNIVEGRTMWIDRGTIVSIKTPEEMSALFDKIKKIGINLVYFETINAGYSIYPSKITEQNPNAAGWDPLYWAIKEAHKRNIELHAWTWIFAAGNTKHNPIIGKSYDFSGPILSKNYDLALLGPDGNLVPTNQHEYWLNPANPKARQIVLSLLEEIVQNYDVDGIQLDYIRYPFQSQISQMGYDLEGRHRFETETGYSLENVNEVTLRAWNNWKTKQVSRFVKDVSVSLRKIKPEIQISAAVFGGNRQKRINSIQQDWETWVENGWVDILNPMIYSTNSHILAENLDYFIKSVGNKALVYPGIAVRQLEETDILEQIYTIKDLGLIGNTIFAMAHMGPEKSEILSNGPYRYKEAKIPGKNPVDSAKSLLDEFLSRVIELKQVNPDDSIVYSYSAEEIITQAEKVQTYISKLSKEPTSEEIDRTILLIQNLECLTQEWLSIQKQTKASRIKLLTKYLKEATTLLTYEQHRINSKTSPVSPILSTNKIN